MISSHLNGSKGIFKDFKWFQGAQADSNGFLGNFEEFCVVLRDFKEFYRTVRESKDFKWV